MGPEPGPFQSDVPTGGISLPLRPKQALTEHLLSALLGIFFLPHNCYSALRPHAHFHLTDRKTLEMATLQVAELRDLPRSRFSSRAVFSDQDCG